MSFSRRCLSLGAHRFRGYEGSTLADGFTGLSVPVIRRRELWSVWANGSAKFFHLQHRGLVVRPGVVVVYGKDHLIAQCAGILGQVPVLADAVLRPAVRCSQGEGPGSRSGRTSGQHSIAALTTKPRRISPVAASHSQYPTSVRNGFSSSPLATWHSCSRGHRGAGGHYRQGRKASRCTSPR